MRVLLRITVITVDFLVIILFLFFEELIESFIIGSRTRNIDAIIEEAVRQIVEALFRSKEVLILPECGKTADLSGMSSS